MTDNLITQQQTIDREIDAYKRMHASLWRTTPNQWVAIHEGELVDQDSDRVALFGRIRAKFGPTSVLIRRVQEAADPEIYERTRTTGRKD